LVHHALAVQRMNGVDHGAKVLRQRALRQIEKASDGTRRVHGVACKIHIPGDDVGRIQARSQPGIAFRKGCLMPAPLGKDRSEGERRQGGAEHGNLGGEDAVGECLARVAVAAEPVNGGPDDAGSNREYGRSRKYRTAAGAEPEQQRKQKTRRLD
jgi:hypothetical protein